MGGGGAARVAFGFASAAFQDQEARLGQAFGYGEVGFDIGGVEHAIDAGGGGGGVQEAGDGVQGGAQAE